MIEKGSRYESAKGFAGEDGKEPVFGGIRPRKIRPAAGVLEYIVKEGDRLDLLSLHFYNNTRRWWRILDANPQIIFGADLMLSEYIGETILIPRSTEPGGGR
jgi:nucleoid-associated protein YgaU